MSEIHGGANAMLEAHIMLDANVILETNVLSDTNVLLKNSTRQSMHKMNALKHKTPVVL